MNDIFCTDRLLHIGYFVGLAWVAYQKKPENKIIKNNRMTQANQKAMQNDKRPLY